LNMNSSISLKKYEQEYTESKKILLRTDKDKRNKYFSFRFFDINLSHGVSSAPQDYF
jgi:hypothetical protein